MKRLLSPNNIGFLVFLLFALPAVSMAQGNNSKKDSKADMIKSLVADQRYVFNAETALPLSGGLRQLNGGYELIITKDTVTSYLPYFGKAYIAPINPSQGGIQFTSAKFTYTVTERKKGGWDIVIKPLDVQDPRQLNLFISENGYAVLQVTSNNRQAISFNGSVYAISTRKK